MVRVSECWFLSILVAASIGLASSSSVEYGSSHGRVLKAATKRDDVFRRSMRIEKKFGAVLSYAEAENTWTSEEIFVSTLKVGSDSPVLNLEEIEHHITSVHCEERSMKLSFVDTVSANDARAACHSGLIITSHEGCNIEGERAVYKVEAINFPDDDASLHLTVQPTGWKDAFTQFDLNFGYTTDSHLHRRHSDFFKPQFRRRQDTSSPSPSAPSDTPVPTDVPVEETEVTFSLAQELTNVTFATSDIPSAVGQVITIPDIPVVLGCRSCSTTGSLHITQGSISIDMSKADFVPDVLEGEDDNRDLLSVITGGFFEIEARDVSAHLDMFAQPEGAVEFELPLPEIPLTPFTIPGVGRAGAGFEPRVLVKFEAEGGIEVNFGFDAVVPASSSIRIELTDIPGSSVTGLQNTTITPLPLTANASDVTLTASITFRPTIPIGFKFLDTFDANINAFLQLPRLDGKLTTQSNNTDANCQPLGTEIELPGALKEIGPLVLVETNVSLAVGVGAEFLFPALPQAIQNVDAEAVLFETTFPIQTGCLAAGKDWVPATEVWTDGPTATAEATAPFDTICSMSMWVPTGGPASSVSSPTANEGNGTVVAPTGTGGYGAPTTAVPTGTGAVVPPSDAVPTGIEEFTGGADGMLGAAGVVWRVAVLGAGVAAGGMVLL